MTQYGELIQEVNRLTDVLLQFYQEQICCRVGCSGCCQLDLSVFEVEAAAVREAIRDLPDKTRRSIARQALRVRELEALGEPLACPLLLGEACAIYESRPIICRTQGLPLLYTNSDENYEVDFCRLNFAAPGAEGKLEQDYMIPLDQMNLLLALANLEYCRSIGITTGASCRRVRMSDLALEIPIWGIGEGG